MKTWSFQNGRGLKIGKWWCFLHCEFHFDHSPLSDLVTRQEKNFDENGETRLYFGKRCFNSTTIKELTTIKCSATNRFLSIFGEKRNEPPKHFHSKCWGHSRAIRLQRSHSYSHLTRSPSIHCALNHFVTKFLQWRWIPAKQPLLSIARVRIDGDRERASRATQTNVILLSKPTTSAFRSTGCVKQTEPDLEVHIFRLNWRRQSAECSRVKRLRLLFKSWGLKLSKHPAGTKNGLAPRVCTGMRPRSLRVNILCNQVREMINYYGAPSAIGSKCFICIQ